MSSSRIARTASGPRPMYSFLKRMADLGFQFPFGFHAFFKATFAMP